MVRMAYSAGQVIHDSGGGGTMVLFVTTGLVKCVRYLPNGEQRILRIAKPGDLIGIELLWEAAYRHRTYALMETEVFRIPSQRLKSLAQADPDFCHWLGGRWLRVLSESERWILDFATGTLQGKVARLIIYLMDGSPGGQREVVLLKRNDMAAILGVASESVCRILGDFQRRGVLTNVQANRYWCDCEKLAAIADRGR